MESIALLTPVVDHAITSVVRQVGYLINYKSNVHNLETQTRELIHAKERLQHDVDEELRKVGQKTEADVEEWLTEVNKIIDEAHQFMEDERHAKKCLNGFCRYHPSRKAAKLSQKIMAELQKRKEFPRLTYSTPLQDIWTTVGYLAFQSRTSIVTQILEDFRKDNTDLIGIYGMGGVGKTTFVKQVARKAEEDKLFDNVVKVEVKQNTEAERIQIEIAEKLGLKFGEYGTLIGRELIVRQSGMGFGEKHTVPGRARILSNFIKDKKILVIFDDVWEELELEKLGVPVGTCKILLTSRTKDVLSSKMGIQTNIQLDTLNEEDTWALFQTIVGDAAKDPNIEKVAIEVASECKGLPILVVTVANALKGKKLHSWNDVLRSLKSGDGNELLQKAYSGIEWSYNQLEGEQVKALFLIFSMLGQRYYHLSDVLKYTMGLGLFEGINAMEEANDRLHSLVNKLKDYCLLLDTNGIITMHDLTREVARKIASTRQHFLSKGYGDEFKEWPNHEVLEKCTLISFDQINVPNLPKELVCPWLQMFLLSTMNKMSLHIPHDFFKEMKELRVLDLTKLCIPSLPPSIQCLTSLQTLCLDHCELRDIAIVGELRNLEILSFLKSKFKQLPKEIGRLTRLRWLDLSGCPELEVVYPDVIKSLTRLEELNMNNSFNKWETKEASNNISGRSNASLSELKHLPYLTTLAIKIKDANQLPVNFFSENLKHFKIFIGDVWDWDAEYATSKSLKLKISQRNQWDQGLESILNRCEDLSLDVFEGVNNIVYLLDKDGFQQLKKLHVQNNPEISHVVHSNIGYSRIHSRTAFPILEALSLYNLVSLESVCTGQLADRSFRQLKIIRVKNCPKLKNLFSFSTILHFLQLEEIEVKDCKNMKEIVEGKEEQLTDGVNDPIEFHGLRSLRLQSLAELISFSSYHSPLVASASRNPMQLFNDKVVFPKLEALKLSSIPLNKLCDGQLSARLCWIQNLTSLIIVGCNGLTFLCSSSMSMNLFVQMKTLEIRRCQNMVEIILTEEYGEVKNMDNMFPKLGILKLEVLENLEKFCTSASYTEFPCLQNLIIEGCTKLGSFIVDPTMRKNVVDTTGRHLFDEKVGFPRLEYLSINGLHKLTSIWHNQLAPDSFCKLIEFSVESCSSLIHILVPGILKRLHSLKELTVMGCESVEEVFEVEGKSDGDYNQSEIFICRNLTEVSILNCKILKNVFPAPVAKLLEKLEKLWIFNCQILGQIVDEEEVGLKTIIPPRFMFPRLMILRLEFLPQLKSFYPGKHTSMWPSLKELEISQCDKIEILAAEYSSFQQQQHQHDTKRPFFLLEKGSYSNLEVLNMWLDFHVLQYSLDSFLHLDQFACLFRDGLELQPEVLETNSLFISCEDTASAVGLSVFLEKFQNLRQLELYFGSMEEILFNEGVSDLKTLAIHGMDNLTQLWKENSHFAGPVFPTLEFLKVEYCGRLKNIMSSAISLRNLVQLEVVGCHGLKHLFTCSVAKSFVQLQSMRVENCHTMVEILGSSDDNGNIDDADANEITFTRLKDLKLSNLPNLKGFCSRNYNVKFPFLKTFSVARCLEMKISIDGVLQNDSKHGVLRITEEEEQGQDDDNEDNNDDVDEFEKWW
ncbi:hypothetical protein FNV43_RR08631 [Rhamnella rubrinervis]|uniref:NB-ARC domain-containing protein n=1 Tax=Rhamnella rubrinervis TaxID=2594499 RepID=A0A8K0H952_9ROSA|nr:hypothetical protein FNV43_RR08631 [Rhamnella rubrinervis]